jgi:hypothetical protein
MLNPVFAKKSIDNFILIKYIKNSMDAPRHVYAELSLSKWNNHQEMMFRTMLEQLHFFYPKANIHVLTNKKQDDTGKIIWHYKPEMEDNHSAKLNLYGLIDQPAMYLDTDILLVKHFNKKHLKTSSPFNIYQVSHTNRDLQSLTAQPLEFKVKQQFNCGMIWIARPSSQIVRELHEIKKQYFNNRRKIEDAGAWFNNDEHPVSYFIKKYNLKMKLFPQVNAFRYTMRSPDIFGMQSIHYTGVNNKAMFVKEYKELCKTRTRIFT